MPAIRLCTEYVPVRLGGILIQWNIVISCPPSIPSLHSLAPFLCSIPFFPQVLSFASGRGNAEAGILSGALARLIKAAGAAGGGGKAAGRDRQSALLLNVVRLVDGLLSWRAGRRYVLGIGGHADGEDGGLNAVTAGATNKEPSPEVLQLLFQLLGLTATAGGKGGGDGEKDGGGVGEGAPDWREASRRHVISALQRCSLYPAVVEMLITEGAMDVVPQAVAEILQEAQQGAGAGTGGSRDERSLRYGAALLTNICTAAGAARGLEKAGDAAKSTLVEVARDLLLCTTYGAEWCARHHAAAILYTLLQDSGVRGTAAAKTLAGELAAVRSAPPEDTPPGLAKEIGFIEELLRTPAKGLGGGGDGGGGGGGYEDDGEDDVDSDEEQWEPRWRAWADVDATAALGGGSTTMMPLAGGGEGGDEGGEGGEVACGTLRGEALLRASYQRPARTVPSGNPVVQDIHTGEASWAQMSAAAAAAAGPTLPPSSAALWRASQPTMSTEQVRKELVNQVRDEVRNEIVEEEKKESAKHKRSITMNAMQGQLGSLLH